MNKELTIAEQVKVWNERILNKENYIVVWNDEDEGVHIPILEEMTLIENKQPYNNGLWWFLGHDEHRTAPYSIEGFLSNLILYSITRIDPTTLNPIQKGNNEDGKE